MMLSIMLNSGFIIWVVALLFALDIRFIAGVNRGKLSYLRINLFELNLLMLTTYFIPDFLKTTKALAITLS